MDECWDLLHPKVRQRISEQAGRFIDRWVCDDSDNRISCVVLGERGLVIAEPTYNTAGRPATALQALPARPGSVRSVAVRADTTAERYGQPARVVPPGHVPVSRLPAPFTEFLGNLPARVQGLLQDPFIETPNRLYCDHFYSERSPSSGVGARTLHVWCYLTDRRTVTFASGRAVTYGPTFEAAVWELTCWLFTVGAAGTDVTRQR